MTNAEKNAIIIAARIAAFKAKMDSSEGTWHRDDVLFMLCFLLVIGAGDNIAKNFYPYTFGVKKIKNGIEITLDDKKFRLRNDDLDTIFPADNQGLDRKPYWLEWFDRYEDGQYIVNAAECAFIALWHRAYFNSTTDRGFVIMRQLLQGLEDLGGKSTQNHLDNLMAWYDKYYTKIKEAFPAMLVNEDMMRYERARVAQLSGTKGTYSEVNPLRQELGDHMITDRGWMKKRLVYIMSMSSYGDFAHDASSGTIVFRLNGNATFDLTPSITMYPTVTAGQTPIRGARTMAGAVCQIMASGTDLDSMINGADYLTDIGEWYNKPIRNNLTVNARMLKELILGTDDDTKIQNMAITISALTVGTCPSLRVLDVRNISTLTGEVSLANCRLLDAVYAEGTSLTNISLADGCPITTLQYPSTNQYITLRGLPLLTTSGINYMNCATSITQFLVSNCPNVNAIQMLGSIIDAQSTQTLTRVYVDGFDETYDNDHIIDVLLKLVNGYQAIDINGYDIPGKPILSGTITIDANISQTKYDTLMAAFGANGLVINSNGFFLDFEDSRVWEICSYNWGETYDVQELDEKDRPMVGTFEEVLDSTPVKSNTVINTSDGTESASTGRSASDFIDIGDYDNIKSSVALSNSVFYDSAQEYVSAANLTTSYLAIPKGVKYVKVSGYNDDMDSAVLTGQGTNNKTVGGHGGVVGSGTLEGGQEEGYIYSEYFFACSTAIDKHGDVPATAARTVKYRIEWEVTGATPTMEGAPWEIPAQSATTNKCLWVGQYTSAMAATDLMAITVENWESTEFWESQESIISDGDGKFHTYVTCTNDCQYLRVLMRAVAGVTVKFKIVSVGVTKLPAGITLEQCAAVTSLSNKLNSNSLLRTFRELRYFGYMTNPNLSACPNLKTIFTGRFTAIASDWSLKHLPHALLPALKTASNWPFRGAGQTYTCLDVGYYTGSLNETLAYIEKTKYIIIRNKTVNTLYRSISAGTVFVREDMVEAFQAHSYWNKDTIAPIGGNEWVTAFGSTSEYANVQYYAPDMYEWYVEEYEKAKAAANLD